MEIIDWEKFNMITLKDLEKNELNKSYCLEYFINLIGDWD